MKDYESYDRNKPGIRFIRGSDARPIINCLDDFLDGDEKALTKLIKIVSVNREDIIKIDEEDIVND